MLLSMMSCGNLRRKSFRNSKNLRVTIEVFIHEKPFQKLVDTFLVVCQNVRHVKLGGDSKQVEGTDEAV
jgi:hypothetical protein